MTKKSKVSNLRQRQTAQAQSKMKELERIEKTAVAPGALLPSAIRAGVEGMKQDINKAQKNGLVGGISWNVLDPLYDEIRKGIWTIIESIDASYQKCKEAKVSDATLDGLVLTAVRDSDHYATKLVTLHDSHAQYKGMVDEKDLDRYYAIGLEYTNIYEGFRNGVFNIVVEISSYMARVVDVTRPDHNLEKLVENSFSQKPEVQPSISTVSPSVMNASNDATQQFPEE